MRQATDSGKDLFSTVASTQRLATGSALTALALIFSYVEMLIPFNFGVPGIKLGLANIVVVVAIYKLGAWYGLAVNIARICLASLLFGNMFSVLYALCGGLVSLAVMLLLKKTDLFSVIGVSMAGGVVHNLAQLGVACLIVQTKQVLLYYPMLLLCGMLTGIITGIIDTLIIKALRTVS